MTAPDFPWAISRVRCQNAHREPLRRPKSGPLALEAATGAQGISFDFFQKGVDSADPVTILSLVSNNFVRRTSITHKQIETIMAKFTPSILITEVVSEGNATSGRVPFMSVATNLTAEGKLPANPIDFDGAAHLKPARADFANPGDFYLFKADQNEAKANDLVASAVKYREEAANIAKFGDPTKRKMAKRAQKLRDQLANLEAQLAAEGFENIG